MPNSSDSKLFKKLNFKMVKGFVYLWENMEIFFDLLNKYAET